MRKIWFGAVATILAAGCAVSEDENDNVLEQNYLDIWVSQNFGNVRSTDLGVYIVDDQPGDGDVYNGEYFAYVTSTVRDLDGNISSTTDEGLSKQLGTYNAKYYYGPKVWYMQSSSLAIGIEQMMEGMRKGGTRTAVIPSWLLGSKRYKKNSTYFKTVTGGSPAMYTVTLEDFFDSTVDWEIDSLERYSSHNLGGLDSLSFGFYYKRTAAPQSEEEFSSDTTIYINYVGRLLNGTVFDTNVADSAKFYGIYNSSTTYGPVPIKWGATADDITMGSASSSSSSYSSPVSGFQKSLWQMHPYESGTGIFYSGLGYTYSGSGSAIPPYSPLMFQIDIVDEE